MNKSEQLIACLEGEIAKRDVEIVELELEVALRDQALDRHAEYGKQLRAMLAAIKAQEPVAYISGCYRDVIDGKSDRTPLGAELAFVNMGWIGQIPLYAAPVSEATIDSLVDELRIDAEALGLSVEVVPVDTPVSEAKAQESCDASCAYTQPARRIGELEAALAFACKSLAQVTSSDGSGHADIAVSVLRMAGRKEADASRIVEAYKAGAKWRIDATLSAGKEG